MIMEYCHRAALSGDLAGAGELIRWYSNFKFNIYDFSNATEFQIVIAIGITVLIVVFAIIAGLFYIAVDKVKKNKRN